LRHLRGDHSRQRAIEADGRPGHFVDWRIERSGTSGREGRIESVGIVARKEALNTEAGQASASAEMATGLPTPQAVLRRAVIGIFLLLLIGGITSARAFLIPVVLGFLSALVCLT
jgi:hypothetical protein